MAIQHARVVELTLSTHQPGSGAADVSVFEAVTVTELPYVERTTQMPPDDQLLVKAAEHGLRCVSVAAILPRRTGSRPDAGSRGAGNATMTDRIELAAYS